VDFGGLAGWDWEPFGTFWKLGNLVEPWFLIVGLGNPGADYVRTRHNAGFMLVDLLAARWKAAWTTERKFQAQLARAEEGGRRVVLCKPVTFMNASGESVGPLAAYYKVPLERILVAVDDADLDLGEIRMRPSGSSGGHHGLESLEQHLGSREFARLRMGIGRERAEERRITGHVLAAFQPAERPLLEKVLQTASEQVECWLASGIARAMNDFNGVIER
jgi:PTH1 family peptidyl-tRNA hydrolase